MEWSGNFFLIAPFPDYCLFVPFFSHNARGIKILVVVPKDKSFIQSFRDRRKTFIESYGAELDGPSNKQTLGRPKSHVSVKTEQKKIPRTGLRKKWYNLTKYVENYQRQIFWVTLYVLVTIGIFVERAHCEYRNIFFFMLKRYN